MVRTSSFYIFLLLGLFSVVSLTGAASNDSQRVAALAEDADFLDGSYAAVAFLYGLVPGPLMRPLIYAIGICFVLVSIRGMRSNVHACIIAILCIAPATLAIDEFQKDLILVVFIMLASLIMTSDRSTLTKVLVISVLYLAYAQFFRFYFILVLALFLAIFFFRSLPLIGKILLVGVTLIVIVNVPLSVWVELQGARDMVNGARLARNGLAGARTAFFNPFPIDGLTNFLLNYLYAMLRLNLPFLFNQGPNELFLFINVVIYVSAVWWSYRHGSKTARMAATLILSHMLVLFLFEPDLGSYIRHLSTTLPYLGLILSEYFARRPWRFVFSPSRI